MKLKKKSESWFMKLLGKLAFFNPDFMKSFWTTIGGTVYVPTRYDNDPDWGSPLWIHRNRKIIEHEKVHTKQYDNFWLFFYVLYLGPAPFLLPFIWLPYVWIAVLATLPLSVGFAVGRTWLELEAYATHIHTENGARWVSDTLWYDYFFSFPKSLTYRWMLSKISKS